VAISRAALQVEYPARFQLIAAMNPCPCGYLGEASGRCRCAPPEIARYRARISGPLLDRIDLRVEVPAVPSDELLGAAAPVNPSQSSRHAAERVRRAREIQQRRARRLNAELSGGELEDYCRLDRRCRLLLAQARVRLALSARGLHRVLRIARTIADLQAAEFQMAELPMASPPTSAPPQHLTTGHLAEALALRRFESYA
jgi:magnesium chelatase family protein